MKSKKIILSVILIPILLLGLLVLNYYTQAKAEKDLARWVEYLKKEKIIVNGNEDHLRCCNTRQGSSGIGLEYRGQEAEMLFYNRIDILCQYALDAHSNDITIPAKYEVLKDMAFLRLGYKRHQISLMGEKKRMEILNAHKNNYWYALYDYYFKSHDYQKIAKTYFKAGGGWEDFYESYEDYKASGRKNSSYRHPWLYADDDVTLLNDYSVRTIEVEPMWID
jgi:hypothetical protein